MTNETIDLKTSKNEVKELRSVNYSENMRTALWWFSCGMATGLVLGIFLTKMFFYAQI